MTKFATTALLLSLSWISTSVAFQTSSPWIQSKSDVNPTTAAIPTVPTSTATATTNTRLNLFDKIFEEEGILGKGVTVGKVQVALTSPDRGPDSIFGILEREAAADKTLPELTHAIALALLRKSDDWVGAAGSSDWFGQKDSGKAESKFNDLSNAEAAKFEKEYIPDSKEEGGGATIVVVSLVIEIEGDSTKFEGAGFSLSGTKEVLSSIASDCMVDDGECLNAVEIFWSPSERSEVLGKIDVITDFPEIIDM